MRARPLRGGNRAIGFLRASWAELQRVQWPDRRQVAQATAVVLGFVAIAGVYLGVADWVAKEIVNSSSEPRPPTRLSRRHSISVRPEPQEP